MGYSIRTHDWRYTEWIARASGKTDRVVARELYDHRNGQLEETVNEVNRKNHATLVNRLSTRLHERLAADHNQQLAEPRLH